MMASGTMERLGHFQRTSLLPPKHSSTPSPASSPERLPGQNRQQGPWEGWPFLTIIVDGLPSDVTTLDIWKNFRTYGHVTRIQIFETRRGDQSHRVEVNFEPPPKPNVLQPTGIPFRSPDGRYRTVYAVIARRQPRSFTIESPTHPDVRYNERTELVGLSLDFGVLTNEREMMIMASRGDSKCPVRMVLQLHYSKIEMYFPSPMASLNREATRSFRFAIALADSFKIWRVSENCYVLHVYSAPQYSKKLKEAIQQTHSSDARRWSEEDMWARQTDIFWHKDNMRSINGSPVSLQKDFNTVNIARWTTFRITLDPSANNQFSENVFRKALTDFNVPVLDGRELQFVTAPDDIESRTWDLINGRAKNDRASSSLHELLGVSLSTPLRYQLEVCLSRGWLSEYAITEEFLRTLSELSEQEARQILRNVDFVQQKVFEPMTIFKDYRFTKPAKPQKLPGNCVEIHAATVTASGVLFYTPTVESTNRIIRKYKHQAHRFLRVHFEDDPYQGKSRLYSTATAKMILIFHRVKRAMQHGIRLGDTLYEFLAWGNSQLKDHAAYFFAGTGSVSVETIRAEMGVFDHESVVAKRAARMGQCFSTTKPVSLRIPPITDSNTIADVRNDKNWIFTDGVGKISPLAAQMVAEQLKLNKTPSAFQFRLGGCKGILAVDPELSGIDIKVRKSQFKFNSSYGELEIIRCAEFWQPFLNRQLIMCLSSLGISDEVFLRKQSRAVKALDGALRDDSQALKALRDNVDPNMMTTSMCELVKAGFRRTKEPFLHSLLHLWRAWSLKYLKEKAKIPVSAGAFLLGAVDETNSLRGHFDIPPTQYPPGDRRALEEQMKNLPEIFVQRTNPQTSKLEIIKGVCVLARNPSLHRGDIRVVRAVDIPKLRHKHDVVVMPQNGDRDLPSMCAGGDLDGDDYLVAWDPELIPQDWRVEPFHYRPPPPREAQGDISVEHIIDFFVDYMQNDFLGRIAHAHLAAADFYDDGLQSPQCLELMELHSMAVDYPKTGIPAKLERRLERTQYPHFMEKKSHTYRTKKVLGRLYDAVQRVGFEPDYSLSFDSRLLALPQPHAELFEAVEELKVNYDQSMQRILARHNIRTEFEVWSTFVLDHSKASKDYKFHEEIGQISKALKDQYYDALCEVAGGRDFERLAPVAIAAYKLTQYQNEVALEQVQKGERNGGPGGMPFISFPWVLQDVLCKLVSSGVPYEVNKTVKTTAMVVNGKLVDRGTELRRNAAGQTVVDVADPDEVDAAFFNASEHMSDPLLQSSETGLHQKADPSGSGLQRAERDRSPSKRSLQAAAVGPSPEGQVFDQEVVHKNGPATRPRHNGKGVANADLTAEPEPKAESPIDGSSRRINDGTGRSLSVNDATAANESRDRHSPNLLHDDDDDDDDEIAKTTLPHTSSSTKTSRPAVLSNRTEKKQASSGGVDTRMGSKTIVSTPPYSTRLENSTGRYTNGASRSSAGRTSDKDYTCIFWKRDGSCRYSNTDCRFAHHDTGMYISRKALTCFYWQRQGSCKYPDDECRFAHYDTGLYAQSPNLPTSSRSPLNQRELTMEAWSSGLPDTPWRSPQTTDRSTLSVLADLSLDGEQRAPNSVDLGRSVSARRNRTRSILDHDGSGVGTGSVVESEHDFIHFGGPLSDPQGMTDKQLRTTGYVPDEIFD